MKRRETETTRSELVYEPFSTADWAMHHRIMSEGIDKLFRSIPRLAKAAAVKAEGNVPPSAPISSICRASDDMIACCAP